MTNVQSTYLYHIVAWIIGFNLLGIPLFFLLLDMQACIDESLPFGFWPGVLISIICGIITGVILGTVDLLLEAFVRAKISFQLWFLLKAIIYLFVFIGLSFVTGTSIRTYQIGDINNAVEETLSNSGRNEILGYIIFSMIYSIGISLGGQVRKAFGKGRLLPLLLGYYFQPRVEEHIFMFLDLNSSTTLAESMGHLQYSSFIQDCFYDLDQLLNKYRARVYQYVGDEVVLTWRPSVGLKNYNCIAIFFAFARRIAEKSAYYQKTYGVVPSFKAGIHMGEATVTEIGGQKKELAYHGDVLNTTARLEKLSGTLDKQLLISKILYDKLGNFKDYQVESLGAQDLAGKNELVEVLSIEFKMDN